MTAPPQVRTTTELGAEYIERHIPGIGTLTFLNAEPSQWLTQKGEPAKKAKREYALLPYRSSEPVVMDAVSSVLGVLDKYALRAWYERNGSAGTVVAFRRGLVTAETPVEDVYALVKEHDLGADAVKREAADRGTAIHAVFEALAKGEEAPDPADFPEQARPWLRGAMAAWRVLDPEPVEVEQIVCSPVDGYAGRPDLVARVGGALTLLDYKSNRGQIFVESMYQTRLYERARRACGFEPCERLLVIGVDDQGGFCAVESDVTDAEVEALLSVFRSRRRVEAMIRAQVSAARKAAA